MYASRRRLYDTARWGRLRERQLRLHPLCRYCKERGKVTAATVCDHIKRHKGDTRLFFDFANLQSLCKQCHDSTKARAELAEERGEGSDETGEPLDPEHHWHVPSW